MTTTTTRKLITAAAITSLLGTGLTAGVITGAGDAHAAPCNSSSSATTKFGAFTHTFQKSVPATAGAAAPVTYSLQVSTSGLASNPDVRSIPDYPATELAGVMPTADVKVFTLINGALGQPSKTYRNQKVTKSGDGWSVGSAGWYVDPGNAVVVDFTYMMPGTVPVGRQVTSGGMAAAGTENAGGNFPNVTACTTIRPPNAGEAVTGSLDASGLGSADGGLFDSGSVEDGISTIISGILGGVLGGILGGSGS